MAVEWTDMYILQMVLQMTPSAVVYGSLGAAWLGLDLSFTVLQCVWSCLMLHSSSCGRASIMWPIPFPPVNIWQATKGLMNTWKIKPWHSTLGHLGHYEHLLNKRGPEAVSLCWSPATALSHQQWCSEFSPQVRRIISAILNLGPKGGV